MSSPIIESAKRTLLNHSQGAEYAARNIQLPPEAITQQDVFVASSDRADHNHGFLSLPVNVTREIGQANINKIDQIRQGFVGIQRDLLLKINDDLVDHNENGQATGITLEIFSTAKNRKAFILDNQILSNALTEVFATINPNHPSQFDKAFQSAFSTDDEGSWSIFSIQPGQKDLLPITINFFQLNTDLDEELENLKNQQGDTFAGYRTHSVEKYSPQNLPLSTKINLLERSSQDFFNNLSDFDLKTVEKIIFAIYCQLQDIPLSEVILIAEGSASYSSHYNDIDLRIIFGQGGKNTSDNPSTLLNEITNGLKDTLAKSKIKAEQKKHTNHRRHSDLGTQIEEVEEGSFEIIVPETGKFIQISLAKAPLVYLEDIYHNSPNRTDLPVILARISSGDEREKLSLRRQSSTTRHPKVIKR